MKRDATRERIIQAACDLLARGGREALSTRAICAESGVQSPAIYRIFGDKQGLLDAVAGHGFESYLADKASLGESDDPVDDLRRGWDLHIGFGVSNPALYSLIYGDARPGVETPAARRASAMLARHIRRIAEAGRLRVSEERAAHLVHSAGRGMTFTLISLPEDRRDPALSTLAREAAIAAVTTAPAATASDTTASAATASATTGGAPAASADDPVRLAVALRAAAPRLTALTPAEHALLREWMDRVASPPA
ncbi:TetR/AcrR family transcriptional regulator [Actinomadura sp. KC345]|uniref:TetR/AcrR family transcriptional regulator n=1 Tax=Actinomadura sp. KC345 TaxID=2530371 RepID=UPI00104ED5F7|nr:TetR/AcrR family transcriptional regulator [Actinomadura sp. KC345]TDC56448.1 TetR/AcrR family transcriptional regulator [Actinomadura sp. KC345]